MAFRDLLERFKRVFTVEEWKKEAQDAIKKKEFVLASLVELHRVEKAAGVQAQERQRTGPIPSRATPQPTPFAGNRAPAKSYAESSLKELMDAVRQQQQAQRQQQQQNV